VPTPTTFTEDTATEIVLARLSGDMSPRLRQVMTSIITHLHAAIREIEPTQEEWLRAIQFLTETGQMCDDKRQEYILLSDTLGVSMLVDAINNRKSRGATESTVLGPFYVTGAPRRALGDDISEDGQGEPCFVSGRVTTPDGRPIAGAELDVWQANDKGFYDVQQPGIQPEMNLRGRFTADADGRFWFRTVKPTHYPVPDDGPVGKLLRAMGRHPYRPAHIHFIVTAPAYQPLTTHIFVAGDPYLDSDAVFGVKDSLIAEFKRVDDPAAMAERGVGQPFYTVEFDFGLEPLSNGAAHVYR
jgi:catechol 1,2-dioxygenase